jgi:hypothetical protein
MTKENWNIKKEKETVKKINMKMLSPRGLA